MSQRRTLPALNVQWPWGSLIIAGKKTIETRSYPIPTKYIGTELLIIETPGPMKSDPSNGSPPQKARIIGTVVFSEPFRYETRTHWEKDIARHLVAPDHDQFSFVSGKPKWGWPLKVTKRFTRPIAAPSNRGIRFTKAVALPTATDRQ